MQLLRREIAGVPVADLAREFGTPTYVYDAARIEAAHRATSRAFDVIRFAQKANSNLAVLDLCRRHGVLVDAVSAGEIHRAFLAGYSAQGDPPPIVYTADVFDRESLELVLEHGIAVNCGSPDMIDQYGERSADGAEIALRVNPGFGHGHSRKTNTGGEGSKHGIWWEDVGEARARAERHGLRVGDAAHAHRLGRGPRASRARGGRDGALRRRSRARASAPSARAAACPCRTGPATRSIDVGRYFAIWDAARKRLEQRFGHALRLEIEPGPLPRRGGGLPA